MNRRNVSRRAVLARASAAGTPRPGRRACRCARAGDEKYGGDGMPGGAVEDPRRLHRHRRGRHGHRHLPPLRDGPGHPHQLRHGRGRRAGGRLGAGARSPRPGRRGALRQPGHRRLAQHAPHLRCRCAGCGAAARRMLEQARPSAGACRSPRSGPRTTRSCTPRPAARSASARWRRPRRRCRCRPRNQLKLKDPAQFRYIGKDDVGLIDGHDITTGQGRLRHRHPARRHALRRRRPPAGLRRQGRELRRGRGAEGARRR